MVAKIGLSANSSTIISIYVSGKMVKENSLKSVKSRLQMCSINIKTIVYREQQKQQLTTLIQACGSVDDCSQQTQQCDKDAPL